MFYHLKILPEAKTDIEASAKWNAAQKNNQDNRFFLQLAETIDYIGSNPKLFPRIYKNIRQAQVSQFPFNVFFSVEETSHEVIILAILYADGNPENRKS